MKTNTLLLLSTLVVLAANVSAAENLAQAETVILPTYVVEASRHLPAVERVNASLNELRQHARTPVTICPDLSAVRKLSNRERAVAGATNETKAVHLAKS